MKKISELMDELGFDPEGSPAVKEAFIKYLIKNTQGVSVLTPTEKSLILGSPEKVKSMKSTETAKLAPNQMQFDFMSETSPKSVKPPKIS